MAAYSHGNIKYVEFDGDIVASKSIKIKKGTQTTFLRFLKKSHSIFDIRLKTLTNSNLFCTRLIKKKKEIDLYRDCVYSQDQN